MNQNNRPTALVAIGGNSLIVDQEHPDIPHQWDAVRETCSHLADMLDLGWRLVITHGNGPQVGFILRRNELAEHEVHPTPLDLIVADTQGAIGYMLQQALKNELWARDRRRQSVVSLVTQVLVDKDDPAFESPSKPVGGFMSAAEGERAAAEGWPVVEDAGRGWRRVVASPIPRRIIEIDAIRDLLARDHVVIAAGGGGIPVTHNDRGELRELKGAYAVIDKDRVSRLLAQQVKADLFLISTGVEKVAVDYRKPTQRDLDIVDVETLSRYHREGQFPPGSMGPKVEAVIRFVRASGKPAVITNPANLARALRRETGTWVLPTTEEAAIPHG